MSATASGPITTAGTQRAARREIGHRAFPRAAAEFFGRVRDEGLVGVVRLPSPEMMGGVAALAPLLLIAFYATGIAFDGRGLIARLVLAYAAFLVSFLGAMWALLIDQGGTGGSALLSPERMALAERGRLLIGIVPALVGGVALLSSFSVGLGLLVLDLLGLVAFEAWGAKGRMKPARHLHLRWGLALAATAILLDVMVYRLYGTRIVF